MFDTGHLKHQRRIATSYDKIALSFGNFLNLAAINRQLNNWLPAMPWPRATSETLMPGSLRILNNLHLSFRFSARREHIAP